MSRELIVDGETPPVVRRPDGPRVAVVIVINYEESSEKQRETEQASRESVGEAPSPVAPQDRGLANESFFPRGARGLARFLEDAQRGGTCGSPRAERSPATGAEHLPRVLDSHLGAGVR